MTYNTHSTSTQIKYYLHDNIGIMYVVFIKNTDIHNI